MTSPPLVLPGLANAHSHAFQRRLRGHVQARPADSTDTFWTWREAMYGLATTLDPAALEEATRACYVECLEAGYTAVGEFHYVHHRADGRPHDDPLAMSRAVLRAAHQAGIRVTLLFTVYARGGFDRDLEPRQRRFGAGSLDTVRRALDALAGEVDGVRSQLGLAIHSVRAVPRGWLGPLATEARERGIPLHAHVAEQPAEVEACLAATGHRPLALLAAEGVLGPDFTAVHATWLDDDEVAALAASGSAVCLCPTTEGDLGDGFPRTLDLHAAGVPLCVGSDSHAVIDPFAELRAAEYQARGEAGRRCVIADPDGQVAPALLRVGADNGYAALALPGDGDFVTLDTAARLFADSGDPLATALTAGHAGLIDTVEVAGERVVEGGRHLAL